MTFWIAYAWASAGDWQQWPQEFYEVRKAMGDDLDKPQRHLYAIRNQMRGTRKAAQSAAATNTLFLWSFA